MRPFFSSAQAVADDIADDTGVPSYGQAFGSSVIPTGFQGVMARVAVYDSPAAAPRVEDVRGSDPGDFIESLSQVVYSLARTAGGPAPYTVVREIVENLIHADFREIVVSIMDAGTIIRFADQGPGIKDKDRALLPGFSTASAAMKRYIRGVGSGLPIVHEFLEHAGGRVDIDDNLGSGTVVTLTMNRPVPEEDASPTAQAPLVDLSGVPSLSLRQKKVLSLVLEYGEAGPTLVSKELGVGLSTAHRDLAFLEQHGLIVSDESGKRVLSELGSTYLDNMFD